MFSINVIKVIVLFSNILYSKMKTSQNDLTKYPNDNIDVIIYHRITLYVV